MSDNNENVTKIQILLPLPLDVASSVMLAVADMYPSSKIQADSQNKNMMTFVIDNKERLNLDQTEAQASGSVKHKSFADPNIESATLDSVQIKDGKLDLSFGTPEFVQQLVAAFCINLLATPEANNYCELEVKDGEEGHYFLTAQRSKGQSPAALHQELRTLVDTLTQEVKQAVESGLITKEHLANFPKISNLLKKYEENAEVTA